MGNLLRRLKTMRLKVGRKSIQIIPEGEIDVAYIEEVLGLKGDHQICNCERVNAYRLLSIAYLEIKKGEV